MAAAGFEPIDYDLGTVEVWPDCAAAWRLFREMATQWRIGLSGRTGLDYTALFARMDRMALTPEAWEDLFADVRTLEAAALAQMDENRG